MLLKKLALEYKVQPGEGAFYGPKIEYILKDSLGRIMAVRYYTTRF